MFMLPTLFLLAGCTTQACGFRDIWQEFIALDYDVYGVSADVPTSQSKWQTKVRCHSCYIVFGIAESRCPKPTLSSETTPVLTYFRSKEVFDWHFGSRRR